MKTKEEEFLVMSDSEERKKVLSAMAEPLRKPWFYIAVSKLFKEEVNNDRI